MDIAAVSMAMSQVGVQQQTSLAVMDKVKDQTEEKGADMIEMLSESAAPHPSKGLQIDVKG
ncbi:YjfB family protein [Halobacillus sp. A1]|uniref:YjfB family protein n=1 Tax=Halobacillus sp. A1 TaxID=2880262 RepID=UPI0020A63A71|nr:YjfB family protein [Halobacillus sp. A1]MCP3032896.1 YjfB family protein [Halobacillus sp. A1]